MHNIRLTVTRLPAALLAVYVAGCGGGGSGSSVTPVPINTPPSLTVISPSPNPAVLDVRSAQTMDVCFKVDDPDPDELSYVCTWNAGSVSPAAGKVKSGSPCTVRFAAPNYNGLCTISVRVTDGEATSTKTVQINVTGAESEPASELRIAGIAASPETAAPGAVVSLGADVRNPGGKPLTYSWQSLYGNLAPSGANAAWTAPRTPGVYGVFITVSDGTSTASYGVAVTVSGPSGGVEGRYFKTVRDKNLVSLDTLVFTRNDPEINFNWWQTSPDPTRLGTDGWGARWSGLFRAEVGGVYAFRAHVDDGARMKVMNDAGAWVEVIPDTTENWIDHVNGAWLPAEPVALNLDGGKWYPFVLEYFEGGENAFIVLYWSVDGGAEEIVPQSMLKPQ